MSARRPDLFNSTLELAIPDRTGEDPEDLKLKINSHVVAPTLQVSRSVLGRNLRLLKRSFDNFARTAIPRTDFD